MKKPPTCRYDLHGIHDRAGQEWLRPLLSPMQRSITVAFFVLWAVFAVRFVLWWFDAAYRVDVGGLVATSAVIGFTLMLPLWLFFTALNAKVPRPYEDLGLDRVAMIVTKAPAEPWPLVRRTLEAMLDQDYSHAYDVWLADENPSDETLVWCASHGVRVSTRHNVEDYHQADWPRRTKSKEGNLAFFYDHWGYREYEIVCQFDADHVPRRDYLRTILRGFANPRAGYVAAPSICSARSAGSWAARGRLHKEAPLHGLLQAGHNGGFGPTCVGSHYAVRTKALREIGGVGPELAEDFSTSFLLAAHGWVGVFDIDVMAEGEGPMTFVDCMTQELQWARSLTTVFLRYSRGHWKHLSGTERFRFGFIQLWYPLFVSHLMIGSLLAPIAVLTDRPWMAVPFAGFFVRAAMPTLVVVAYMFWVRRQAALRPVDAPVLSWESSLFNVTRWPWNALGIAQAVIGALRNKTYNFRVTPKEQDGHQPLPWTALAPTGAIAIAQAGVVMSVSSGNSTLGYVLITCVGALIYAIASVAVVAAHLRENPTPSLGDALRANRGAIAIALVAALSAFAAVLKVIWLFMSFGGLRVASRLIGWNELESTSVAIYVIALLAVISIALADRASRDRTREPQLSVAVVDSRRGDTNDNGSASKAPIDIDWDSVPVEWNELGLEPTK